MHEDHGETMIAINAELEHGRVIELLPLNVGEQLVWTPEGSRHRARRAELHRSRRADVLRDEHGPECGSR